MCGYTLPNWRSSDDPGYGMSSQYNISSFMDAWWFTQRNIVSGVAVDILIAADDGRQKSSSFSILKLAWINLKKLVLAL